MLVFYLWFRDVVVDCYTTERAVLYTFYCWNRVGAAYTTGRAPDDDGRSYDGNNSWEPAW